MLQYLLFVLFLLSLKKIYGRKNLKLRKFYPETLMSLMSVGKATVMWSCGERIWELGELGVPSVWAVWEPPAHRSSARLVCRLTLWRRAPWQALPCGGLKLTVLLGRGSYPLPVLLPQPCVRVVVSIPSLLPPPNKSSIPALTTPEYCLFLVIFLHPARTFGTNYFPKLASKYPIWGCHWFCSRTWPIGNEDVHNLLSTERLVIP